MLFTVLYIRLTLDPGANPTVVSYNPTSSLVRFEVKQFLFFFYKHSSLVVNSKVVGLAPGRSLLLPTC
jgi:hypothetical protein